MGANDYVFGNIMGMTSGGLRDVFSQLSTPMVVITPGQSAVTSILNTWTGAASGFTTTMTGGTLKYLYGGYSTTQEAANNTVNLNGGTVTTVYGGCSQKTNANNNQVTIASGATVNEVYGGNANNGTAGAAGNADNNTITINGGTIGGITGAYSAVGSVTGNKVIINATDSPINGAYLHAGYGKTDATGNIFTINGGEISSGVLGITGAFAYNGTATANEVNITGGTVNSPVEGGHAMSGQATNNKVTVSGGTINNSITGGWGYTRASDNTVAISDGTITGTVIGGQSSNGDATNNIVTISGGSISGMVTGGMATSGTASNNTVNILAAMTLMGINGGSGADGSDNTVNFAAKGITITDNIYGAENMNFYLPDDISAGDTMVTVNGGTTYLMNTTIGVAAQTGVNLNQGDTVTLLSNANGFTGTAKTTTLTTAPTATSLTLDTSYKFAVNQESTSITATVTDKTESSTESSSARAKSLVETRAATTTFVNAGADMLSSQGFMQAANAVALEAAEQSHNGAVNAPAVSSFTPFAAVGGSSMRAQSGSYVDTKGFGLNVGFAREISNAQGKLLFGPIVEYGGGNYDSYLEDAAGTHGEGKAHYFGVGLMARQVNHDGLYYEGSLRGGRVNSDYKSTMDTLGKVDYDSSSNYFAAHLGVGKAFNLGNGNTLDGYLKYFYSHQAGDTTTIHIEKAADERGSFSAVDSHRLRIGARLTHKVNDRNSFYGGLAYQYEFGGEARAHFSSGGNVPSPSVKGGSGMLELGWQVKPGGPIAIDLGMTGWAGKQRGGSVQLGATWKF